MAGDAAYLIALTNIFGIGPVGAVSVARTFTTPDALENASSAELDKALGERWANAIRGQLKNGWQSLLTKSQNVVSEHLKSGIRPIAVTEDEYPALLRLIPDPPPVLYAKGNIPLLKVLDAVAVIGTRKPTTGGTKVASKVAGHLASSGFVIVSGLARGIDSAAHRAACDAGFTIAVLANPLDKVYPAENRELAENIVDGGGTLVAELPKGEPTYRNAFVRRDRIQSGMSLAVIPVQTDVEGGTMHTVRFAEAQHRLLFCPKPLPEESNRKEYGGIWQLLRANRATEFQREDYTSVISKVRERKTKWIHEYHLVDTPLPQRPKAAIELKERPAPKDKTPAEKLEELCRALRLDADKKVFNSVMAKVRTRLFGKNVGKKESGKEQNEKQQLALLAGATVQRHSERRDKSEEEAKRKRAVAKALLYEIKNFYHWYYRHLRPLLPPNLDLETCPPPTISAPTAQFFMVYRANMDTLGTLDDAVVELVVKFYGLAERLLAAIQEYRTALAFELQLQKNVPAGSAPRKLLREIQTIMFDTDRAAVNAGRSLGSVAGMSDDPFAKMDD